MKESKRHIGFKYAFNGLLVIIKEERNFKIHILSAIAVIVLSIILQINTYEWIVIMMTIHIVLLMELINSVIERLIDYLRPEIHPKAKKIKDIGAAIVLTSVFMSIVVGLIIFLPKLLNLFS